MKLINSFLVIVHLTKKNISLWYLTSLIVAHVAVADIARRALYSDRERGNEDDSLTFQPVHLLLELLHGSLRELGPRLSLV
jgi:hypothetical protein